MINCVIIGNGNIAEALLKSINNTDIEVIGIYGKSIAKCEKLSELYSVPFFPTIESLPNNADLYLICVSDNAIAGIANKLTVKEGLAVHFSGIKSLQELEPIKNKAVFWPIASINKLSFKNFSETPICIEASDEENYRIIEAFADRLSKKVFSVSTSQRQYLHLAATLTNNFSNHLLALSKQILDEQQIDYHLLQHLLTEALQNSFLHEPSKMQTGPALRNDTKTIHTHKMLLNQNIALITLYELMSKSIFEMKQNNHA